MLRKLPFFLTNGCGDLGKFEVQARLSLWAGVQHLKLMQRKQFIRQVAEVSSLKLQFLQPRVLRVVRVDHHPQRTMPTMRHCQSGLMKREVM